MSGVNLGLLFTGDVSIMMGKPSTSISLGCANLQLYIHTTFHQFSHWGLIGNCNCKICDSHTNIAQYTMYLHEPLANFGQSFRTCRATMAV